MQLACPEVQAEGAIPAIWVLASPITRDVGDNGRSRRLLRFWLRVAQAVGFSLLTVWALRQLKRVGSRSAQAVSASHQ